MIFPEFDTEVLSHDHDPNVTQRNKQTKMARPIASLPVTKQQCFLLHVIAMHCLLPFISIEMGISVHIRSMRHYIPTFAGYKPALPRVKKPNDTHRFFSPFFLFSYAYDEVKMPHFNVSRKNHSICEHALRLVVIS